MKKSVKIGENEKYQDKSERGFTILHSIRGVK